MSRDDCAGLSRASPRLNPSATINQFYQCRIAIWWCLSWLGSTWCHTKGWRRIVVSCLLESTCSEFRSNFRSSRDSRPGIEALWSDHSGWRSGAQSRNVLPSRLLLWLRTLALLISAAIPRCVPTWNSCKAAFSRQLCATWSWSDHAVTERSLQNSQVHRAGVQGCPHLRHRGPTPQSSTFSASVTRLTPS